MKVRQGPLCAACLLQAPVLEVQGGLVQSRAASKILMLLLVLSQVLCANLEVREPSRHALDPPASPGLRCTVVYMLHRDTRHFFREARWDKGFLAIQLSFLAQRWQGLSRGKPWACCS
jgi:hypothetical protein